MTFARLSAVYHLSYDDIRAMPLAAIRAYMDRIPAVQAEQRIILGDGATVPWTKDPNKTMKNWRKVAYESFDSNPAPATPGVLKLMGIGVKYAS